MDDSNNGYVVAIGAIDDPVVSGDNFTNLVVRLFRNNTS